MNYVPYSTTMLKKRYDYDYDITYHSAICKDLGLSGFGSLRIWIYQDSDLSGFGSVRIRISQDHIGYDTVSIRLSCVREFYFKFSMFQIQVLRLKCKLKVTVNCFTYLIQFLFLFVFFLSNGPRSVFQRSSICLSTVCDLL